MQQKLPHAFNILQVVTTLSNIIIFALGVSTAIFVNISYFNDDPSVMVHHIFMRILHTYSKAHQYLTMK